MKKKPTSAAARTRVLPDTPSHAVTIAGEMRTYVVSLIENEIFSYVQMQAAPRRDAPLPPPPKHLINVGAGVGKTRAAVAGIIRAVELGMRAVIAVPTTKLGIDIHEQLEKQIPGVSGVWFGRDKTNPQNPAQKMCPRHDAAHAAYSIGVGPSAACGNRAQGFCPHYPKRGMSFPCAYRQQNLRDKKAVIIAGDKMLELAPAKKMQRKKKQQRHKLTEAEHQIEMEGFEYPDADVVFEEAIGDDAFDVLFVDETNPFAFVKGFDNGRPFFPSEHLETKLSERTDFQTILSNFLWELNETLTKAIGQHMPQYFCGLWDEPNPVLLALDILECVHEIAKERLYEIAEEAKTNRELARGSGEKILNTAANLAAQRNVLLNIKWICEAMMLGHRKEIEPLAHLFIERRGDTAGLQVRRKTKMFVRYLRLPTLFFDATAEGQLLEFEFGNIDQCYHRTAVDGAGVKRYQLRDEVLPYSKFDNPKWAQRIRLFAELLELTYGSVGLVVPMKVEQQIADSISGSISMLHFGEERGVNALEDVAALVVASRQAKPPVFLEDMVTVLSETPVQRLPEDQRWFQKQEDFIKHRDQNAGWLVQRDFHPDTNVESTRRLITGSGLEQALARGRNVRRDESKPLHEYILTSTPTSRLVDATFTKNEFLAATGWIGELLLAGVWVADGKGQNILLPIFRGICSQRRGCFLEYIIDDSAFERPEKTAKWRKDQLANNSEIARLIAQIDRNLKIAATSVDLLFAPFPLTSFQPIKAKVRGARFFANVYVRVAEGQSARKALTKVLGPFSEDVEIDV